MELCYFKYLAKLSSLLQPPEKKSVKSPRQRHSDCLKENNLCSQSQQPLEGNLTFFDRAGTSKQTSIPKKAFPKNLKKNAQVHLV